MPYHQFSDDSGDSGEEFGSFEVFYSDEIQDSDGETMPPGFFWWACFPGCLPDGEPIGPFETESEAIEDANNF